MLLLAFHSNSDLYFSRNFQRSLDNLQNSLDAEGRSKAEYMRIRKKLEGDISDLEIAVDNANRARSEVENACKRYQSQMKVSNST